MRGAPSPAPRPSPDLPEELTFDVGRVIAGQVLTHAFAVENACPETITIRGEGDIQLDCACSSILPGRRTLPPGERTEITVTVRTGGLRRNQGRFAHGGKMVWTLEGGGRRAMSLVLRGEAVAPFAADPPALAFTPDEVKRGAAKELVLTAAAPVDWGTWEVTSSSPYFQVVEAARPVTGDRARCTVRCVPPEGVADFRGEIRVTARARLAGSPGVPVSATVPVQARQAVALAITPRVASVVFGPRGEPARLQLMLRGEEVARGQIQIQEVRYEGCAATWKLSRGADAAAAVLEVTLTPEPKAGKANAIKDPVLLIQLVGGRSIPWPAVEVGPSLDAP